MEKVLDRISTDLLSTLVNLSGSLKDIGYGTLIKIPTDAGYVKFYKSHDAWNLSCWISQTMMMENKETNDTEEFFADEVINKTKST